MKGINFSIHDNLLYQSLKPENSTSNESECSTCKSRTYQDGSNENVSYKSPTHLDVSSAPSAVRAHENEHVNNAYSKATQNNGSVINATVTIRTAICPECGKNYVSGGVTNTVIKYENEANFYQQQKKSQESPFITGMNLDYQL